MLIATGDRGRLTEAPGPVERVREAGRDREQRGDQLFTQTGLWMAGDPHCLMKA